MMAVTLFVTILVVGVVVGFPIGLFFERHYRLRRLNPLEYVISVDGENFIIVERTWDLHGGSTITLIDQGTFERQNRIDG